MVVRDITPRKRHFPDSPRAGRMVYVNVATRSGQQADETIDWEPA